MNMAYNPVHTYIHTYVSAIFLAVLLNAAGHISSVDFQTEYALFCALLLKTSDCLKKRGGR